MEAVFFYINYHASGVGRISNLINTDGHENDGHRTDVTSIAVPDYCRWHCSSDKGNVQCWEQCGRRSTSNKPSEPQDWRLSTNLQAAATLTVP